MNNINNINENKTLTTKKYTQKNLFNFFNKTFIIKYFTFSFHVASMLIYNLL